jgi:hypothetical protein
LIRSSDNKPTGAESKTAANTKSGSKSETPPPKITKTSTNQDQLGQQITSDNGYSLKFPSNWTASNQKTQNGDEALEISTDNQQGTNLFKILTRVSTMQDSTYQPAAIANGKITVLSNGLEVWEQNETTSKRPNPETSCPTLQIVSKDSSGVYHFSKKLGENRYLTVMAGYCMFESAEPSLPYTEQLSSKDWKDAISTLSTLSFKK